MKKMSLVHYLTGGDGRAVDIVQEFEHLQCMGFFNRHYDRIKGGGGGGRRDRGWGKREGGGGVFGKRPVRGEASVPVLTRTRKSGYDSGLDYH